MSSLVIGITVGLTLGGTFVLIALGMVLGFRATSTLNFAHGQFMVFAAFMVGHWQATSGRPWWVDVTASIAIMAAIGAVFYRLVLQPTIGLPHYVGLIASLGVAAIFDGLIGIVFGADNQYVIRIPVLPEGTFEIAGVAVSTQDIVLAAFSFALAGVVAAVLRFTQLGVRVRAVGQHPVLASQGGINVRAVYMGSWAIASALAGVAGIVYGATSVVGTSMVEVALLAFPAMLLGGIDSITGAIVGGVLVGLLQGVVYAFLGGGLVALVTYAVLLGVMLIRPRGLFGTREVARA